MIQFQIRGAERQCLCLWKRAPWWGKTWWRLLKELTLSSSDDSTQCIGRGSPRCEGNDTEEICGGKENSMKPGLR